MYGSKILILILITNKENRIDQQLRLIYERAIDKRMNELFFDFAKRTNIIVIREK